MCAPAGDPSNWNPTCWNGSAKRGSRRFQRPDTSCAGERRSTASCVAPTRSLRRRPSVPACPPDPLPSRAPNLPVGGYPRSADSGRRTRAQMSLRVIRLDPLRTAHRCSSQLSLFATACSGERPVQRVRIAAHDSSAMVSALAVEFGDALPWVPLSQACVHDRERALRASRAASMDPRSQPLRRCASGAASHHP